MPQYRSTGSTYRSSPCSALAITCGRCAGASVPRRFRSSVCFLLRRALSERPRGEELLVSRKPRKAQRVRGSDQHSAGKMALGKCDLVKANERLEHGSRCRAVKRFSPLLHVSLKLAFERAQVAEGHQRTHGRPLDRVLGTDDFFEQCGSRFEECLGYLVERVGNHDVVDLDGVEVEPVLREGAWVLRV